ncbi:hypothetical protein L1887_08716 [Cichorium endivia]|nr:hypothetical protein L1887_08716 [Cichorium endivia]
MMGFSTASIFALTFIVFDSHRFYTFLFDFSDSTSSIPTKTTATASSAAESISPPISIFVYVCSVVIPTAILSTLTHPPQFMLHRRSTASLLRWPLHRCSLYRWRRNMKRKWHYNSRSSSPPPISVVSVRFLRHRFLFTHLSIF